MDIYGLMKLTLLDYPGKTAATVFLGGCNLRCPFCHNSELTAGDALPQPVMDSEELISFLEKRKGLLEGVCISGGEPLMLTGTEDLIKAIKDMGYPVKLDTNGTFPGRLRELCSKGLIDYVAMDIKSDRKGYAESSGIPQADTIIEKVDESIRYLINEAGIPYEFRTTVVNELHGEDTFRNIAEWVKGAKDYYLQPFTDRETVVYAGFSAPSKEQLERYVQILGSSVDHVEIRGV